MEQIFLSRRNLLTLLSKLDRKAQGEATACTLVKSDNVHPTHAQSMPRIAVTAVEDAEYYGRPPGRVLAADEPVVDSYLPPDVVEFIKEVATHGIQLGLVVRAGALVEKYVK